MTPRRPAARAALLAALILAGCAQAGSDPGAPQVAIPDRPQQPGEVVPHAIVLPALPAPAAADTAGLSQARLTRAGRGFTVTRLPADADSACRFGVRSGSPADSKAASSRAARFQGKIQGADFCQFDLHVHAGQRLTLTLSGPADMAVFDRTDLALVSGQSIRVQQTGVWPLRVLLPRSEARRSPRPLPFTLEIAS